MKRVLICFFLFGLAGCSSDDCNDCGGFKPPPPGPPGRTTPQNSLEYYRLAWQSRDSTQIDSVLADDYQGTSTDMGPVTETLTFTKSDEIRAVHNMKLDADLTRVTVDLGHSSSWIRDSYAGDPPGWAVLTVPTSHILLSYASGSDLATSINSSNEFKLKPIVSGADTTWQIVRWKEIHTGP